MRACQDHVHTRVSRQLRPRTWLTVKPLWINASLGQHILFPVKRLEAQWCYIILTTPRVKLAPILPIYRWRIWSAELLRTDAGWTWGWLCFVEWMVTRTRNRDRKKSGCGGGKEVVAWAWGVWDPSVHGMWGRRWGEDLRSSLPTLVVAGLWPELSHLWRKVSEEVGWGPPLLWGTLSFPWKQDQLRLPQMCMWDQPTEIMKMRKGFVLLPWVRPDCQWLPQRPWLIFFSFLTFHSVKVVFLSWMAAVLPTITSTFQAGSRGKGKMLSAPEALLFIQEWVPRWASPLSHWPKLTHLAHSCSCKGFLGRLAFLTKPQCWTKSEFVIIQRERERVGWILSRQTECLAQLEKHGVWTGAQKTSRSLEGELKTFHFRGQDVGENREGNLNTTLLYQVPITGQMPSQAFP